MTDRPIISCTGKHSYQSSAAARRVIRELQASARKPWHPHKTAKSARATLSTYHCRFCNGWHIGGDGQ